MANDNSKSGLIKIAVISAAALTVFFVIMAASSRKKLDPAIAESRANKNNAKADRIRLMSEKNADRKGIHNDRKRMKVCKKARRKGMKLSSCEGV